MRVVVVGAGIIGTTSAFRLKTKYPSVELSIVAAELSPHTTSDIAAGWWEPHLDPDTPPDRVNRWAQETYNLCAALARGEWVEELGDLNNDLATTVRRMQGMEVDSNDKFLNPVWSDITTEYRALAHRDIQLLGLARGDPVFGHAYLSFTWEPRKVLPILYSWLRRHGVEIIKRKVTSLSELEDECDLVVNCTGLGAWHVVPDHQMVPVSGHVLRVEAPWVGSVMCDSREESWAYIIPNMNNVVLGSVDTKGNWDTRVQEGNREAILERCDKLCPGLKDSALVDEAVGLRPCRTGGVRLEWEKVGTLQMIHNYGHGGSGVTLSWGCASEVVQMFGQFIEGN